MQGKLKVGMADIVCAETKHYIEEYSDYDFSAYNLKGSDFGTRLDDLKEGKTEGFETSRKIFEGFNSINENQLASCELNGKLRNYQSYGVKWMSYLAKNNLGYGVFCCCWTLLPVSSSAKKQALKPEATCLQTGSCS